MFNKNFQQEHIKFGNNKKSNLYIVSITFKFAVAKLSFVWYT